MDEINLPSIEDLLRDLSDDAPSGRDLRIDTTPQSIYFRLRDARSEARAQERAVDTDPSATDDGSRRWIDVGTLATAAILNESKDLEVAAWLTESMVRAHGLCGLAAGAELMCGLVERFWARNLFPQPDEDGVGDRLAPVAGLDGEGGNGTLLQPLRKLAMFERGDGTAVAFWQFEQSEEVASLTGPARGNQRLTADIPPFAVLEAEARGAGRRSLAKVVTDAGRAIAAWQALGVALDAAAGRDAPSTTRVLDLLTKLHRVASRYAGLPEETGEPAAEAEAVPASAAATPPAPAPPAKMDREVLLAELSRIAALFRKAEPNAPISYTIDEAVRRARLSLPELLREMMPDEGLRAALLGGLGISRTAQ